MHPLRATQSKLAALEALIDRISQRTAPPTASTRSGWLKQREHEASTA